MTSNKWVVITTINPPNPRVLEFAELGYKILIVGDLKTPKEWIEFDNRIEFLDYTDQEREFNALSNIIGPNTYARKNLGYLYAIKNGAEIIWETDDDTFPLKSPIDPISALNMNRVSTISDDVWNPYTYYLPEVRIWPRGFPLERIHESFHNNVRQGKSAFSNVDIIQTLVNNEPDVDAIYRLTVNDKPSTFSFKGGVVEIEKGIAPGNTQSTVWLTKQSFKSIYFPVTVNNRFADIIKMYLAQVNNNLVYAGFFVEQFRNAHDYMIDFQDEITMYKNLEKLCSFVLLQNKSSLEDLYLELAKMQICDFSELKKLAIFQRELDAIFNS